MKTEGFCGAHTRPRPCAPCATVGAKSRAYWADPVGKLVMTGHLVGRPRRPWLCITCGAPVSTRKAKYCSPCYRSIATERARARWRDPEYRARQQTYRGDPHNGWQREEDTILKQLIGIVGYDEIARQCSAASGINRSHVAAARRARTLGLDTLRKVWTRRDLHFVFGVSTETVGWWHKAGYLELSEYGQKWCASDAAIQRFIRDYSWLFDVDRMVRGAFRSLAEVVQRRDPWWTTARLASELHLSNGGVQSAVESGALTVRRRGGAHGGNIVVRAADIPAYHEWHERQIEHWRTRRALNLIPGGGRWAERSRVAA